MKETKACRILRKYLFNKCTKPNNIINILLVFVPSIYRIINAMKIHVLVLGYGQVVPKIKISVSSGKSDISAFLR